MEPRIKALRERLGWSQRQMAAYLRLGQPAVSRMEAGQREQGPVSVILDKIEDDLRDAGRQGSQILVAHSLSDAAVGSRAEQITAGEAE